MARKRRSGRPEEADAVSRERKHQKYAESIYDLYRHKCWLCGKSGADTIDHIVPVLWGGADHPANLKPAHRSCNSSKGAERPENARWGEPALWMEGYGPRREDGRVLLPRPYMAGMVVFLEFALLAGILYFVGVNMGLGSVAFLGLIVAGIPLFFNFCVKWVWTLRCHRQESRAREYGAIPSPEDWLRQAFDHPPPLR